MAATTDPGAPWRSPLFKGELDRWIHAYGQVRAGLPTPVGLALRPMWERRLVENPALANIEATLMRQLRASRAHPDYVVELLALPVGTIEKAPRSVREHADHAIVGAEVFLRCAERFPSWAMGRSDIELLTADCSVMGLATWRLVFTDRLDTTRAFLERTATQDQARKSAAATPDEASL